MSRWTSHNFQKAPSDWRPTFFGTGAITMLAAELCLARIIIAIRVIIAHAHLSSHLCPPSINCGTGHAHAPWRDHFRLHYFDSELSFRSPHLLRYRWRLFSALRSKIATEWWHKHTGLFFFLQTRLWHWPARWCPFWSHSKRWWSFYFAYGIYDIHG